MAEKRKTAEISPSTNIHTGEPVPSLPVSLVKDAIKLGRRLGSRVLQGVRIPEATIKSILHTRLEVPIDKLDRLIADAIEIGSVVRIYSRGDFFYLESGSLPEDKLGISSSDLSFLVRRSLIELRETDRTENFSVEEITQKTLCKYSLLKTPLLLSAIYSTLERCVRQGRLIRGQVKPYKYRFPSKKFKLYSRGPVKPNQLCSFCLCTAEDNKQHQFEQLLSCHLCGNSGHPSCLKYSQKLVLKIRCDEWECLDCKMCVLCSVRDKAASTSNKLLICDACDKGYHMDCLEPPLFDMPRGKWFCYVCEPIPPPSSELEKPLSLGSPLIPKSKKEIAAIMRAEKSIPKSPQSPVRLERSGGMKRTRSSLRDKSRLLDTLPAASLTSPTRKKIRTPSLSSSATKLPGRKKKTPKQLNSPAPLPTLLVEGVPVEEGKLFYQARDLSAIRVTPNQSSIVNSPKCLPPKIHLGQFEIDTWYTSVYPQEYALLPILYICEFCLKYMKSYEVLLRHKTKCTLTNPPAREIYRKEGQSVFEIDGKSNTIYCQNLCLLGKLFLDHKTLYYDVEPFIFYVLTKNDEFGCHIIGYFSKEKYQQKFNLSCIMTLPAYQKQGYGKFLIQFSYLLSLREQRIGTPEKPLSLLGRVAYISFWKSAILDYITANEDKSLLCLQSLSEATSIDPFDLADTLETMDWIKLRTNDSNKKDLIFSFSSQQTREHQDKLSKQKNALDSTALHWVPTPSMLQSKRHLSNRHSIVECSQTDTSNPFEESVNSMYVYSPSHQELLMLPHKPQNKRTRRKRRKRLVLTTLKRSSFKLRPYDGSVKLPKKSSKLMKNLLDDTPYHSTPLINTPDTYHTSVYTNNTNSETPESSESKTRETPDSCGAKKENTDQSASIKDGSFVAEHFNFPLLPRSCSCTLMDMNDELQHSKRMSICEETTGSAECNQSLQEQPPESNSDNNEEYNDDVFTPGILSTHRHFSQVSQSVSNQSSEGAATDTKGDEVATGIPPDQLVENALARFEEKMLITPDSN